MEEKNLSEYKKTRLLSSIYKWCCHYEVYISILILTTVLIYALWSLLMAPNSYYPNTADGLGHLAKIKYIADSFKDCHWPSWFPDWYSGATVFQYYPPLAYIFLAPIQMIFNNVMITFKFWAFLSLFTGAIGVWLICYRWVGPIVGIWGGILYILQPFLLRLVFIHGTIAQGAIIAISPWLLFTTFLFLEKKSALKWLVLCILISLLILSHAMHAFLVTLSIAFMLITLLIFRRIKLIDFLIWGLAVTIGAGLVCFWTIPGVTPLETPGVPTMSTDYLITWTTGLDWFNPVNKNPLGFYFSLPILLVSLLSVFWIRKPTVRIDKSLSKDTKEYLNNKNYPLIPVLGGFVFSILISFGHIIPGYYLIPMSGSIFPGRFLTFSALTGSILCAIFVQNLFRYWRSGFWLALSCCIFLTSSIFILRDSNDSIAHALLITDSFSYLQNDIKQLNPKNNSFENGRIDCKWMPGCQTIYFSMINNLAATTGWNPEGSPHYNGELVLQNIALAADCNNYLIKNLMQWNTRTIFTVNNQESAHFREALSPLGFKEIKANADVGIFYNPAPPSYFMRQERNAFVIGKAAPGLAMAFPWLVKGDSIALEDYSYNYLQRFKLIYIAEPKIKDFKKFQNMISELAGSGKVIIVSMGRSETWSLLDVIPYWETINSGAKLVPTSNSPFKNNFLLDADPYGRAPAMGNLDEVWMEMMVDNKRVPAIGYKTVNGHRVYFVGLSLDQQLNSSVKWITGAQAAAVNSKEIASLLEQLMDLGYPNKNFISTAVPVSDAVWEHDGFSFNYKSEEPVSMLVSVTYTPRWKGKLDNSPLKVQQLENLILLDLPAGEHQVSMHYGMTWVGWLGIALSIFSLLLVIFIYRRFEDLDRFFAFLSLQIRRVVKGLGA